MNIETIYNTVKPSLIEGALYKDIYYDIEATAWQYAYMKCKGYKANNYNEVFLHHYVEVIRYLRQYKDNNQ
jgi:hypothetical protein